MVRMVNVSMAKGATAASASQGSPEMDTTVEKVLLPSFTIGVLGSFNSYIVTIPLKLS